MKGFFLAVLALFAVQAQALNFEQVLIDTGLRLGEPARVANLDGKAHLLVVGTDAQGEQQLRIYGIQRGAEASLQLSLDLGPDLLFMDVARVPGGEALCFRIQRAWSAWISHWGRYAGCRPYPVCSACLAARQ